MPLLSPAQRVDVPRVQGEPSRSRRLRRVRPRARHQRRARDLQAAGARERRGGLVRRATRLLRAGDAPDGSPGRRHGRRGGARVDRLPLRPAPGAHGRDGGRDGCLAGARGDRARARAAGDVDERGEHGDRATEWRPRRRRRADHGRRGERARLGGDGGARRREHPLFRRRAGRRAAGGARNALSPRADDHRDLLVVAGRSVRGVSSRDDRRGHARAALHAPPAARSARRGCRSHAYRARAQGLRDAMRAQVFHGPGDLRFEDVPWPTPGPGEIVVKIEAALTCGTDVKVLRRGHPVMIPHVPTVFGHEFAGTVARLGRGVTTLREGDRVVAANSAPCGACRCCRSGRQNLCEDLFFVNGGYGEYLALPPRLVATNVVRLGPSLPARRAAFAEPLACALLGIERGRIEKGMTVAVIGHGPLGWLLALVVAQRAARPLLVGKPGWRHDRVRSLGIAECLEAGSDLAASLRAAAGGGGVDVAVDATGLPDVWEQAVASVGRGGTVVFFGGCAPGTTIAVDTRRAHYEELTLVGAFHHTPALIRQAVGLLESESLVPDGLVTHTMGLERVREALGLMERGEALKVLIEPWRDATP